MNVPRVDLSRDGLSRSQARGSLTLEREVSRLEQELAAASAEITTDHLTQDAEPARAGGSVRRCAGAHGETRRQAAERWR
jgi:hypothetical protein